MGHLFTKNIFLTRNTNNGENKITRNVMYTSKCLVVYKVLTLQQDIM